MAEERKVKLHDKTDAWEERQDASRQVTGASSGDAICAECGDVKRHHDYLHSTHPFKAGQAGLASGSEPPQYICQASEYGQRCDFCEGGDTPIQSASKTYVHHAKPAAPSDLKEQAEQLLNTLLPKTEILRWFGRQGFQEVIDAMAAFASRVSEQLQREHSTKTKDLIQQGLKQIQDAERVSEGLRQRNEQLERWLNDAATAVGNCDLDSVAKAVEGLRQERDAWEDRGDRLRSELAQLRQELASFEPIDLTDWTKEARISALRQCLEMIHRHGDMAEGQIGNLIHETEIGKEPQ